MEKLKVKISRTSTHPNPLPLPLMMTSGSSGCDLMADILDDMSLAPKEFKLIPTGIALSIPHGFEAQVRPRSGLALKHGITILNTPGTIDSDYRGEIKLIVINLGPSPVAIRRGDRIAQLVFQKICPVVWEEVNQLDETRRSDGGFGHTGGAP